MGARGPEAERLGCETEVEREVFRWGVSEDAALLARKPEKMASAAANVGSSLFAAGVPVRDRDRLVDFPNDPVSATALLVRDTGFPSLLVESSVKKFMVLRNRIVVACSPRKDHRVGSLYPIVSDIKLFVWNIMQN